MRKIFLLSALFVLLSSNLSRSEEPILQAVGSPWDFGEVRRGETAEKKFLLKNVSGESVVIENVSACCGYGVLDISSWEIAPGASTEMVLTCDTSRKNTGRDGKKLTVRLKLPEKQVFLAELTVEVVE